MHPPPRPTLRDRLGWCGLAMVPAALLTAFTTHVATDIASAPLLWVLPLALYLATFILAFQDRVPIPMSLLLPLQLGSVIFALFELAQIKYDKWTLTSSAGVAVFFLSALLAHRRLYLSRPQARDLTEFYLWMSFGGVLGGLFSALLRAQAVLGDLRIPAADRADGRLPPRCVQAARGVTPRDALAARYRRDRPPAGLVR